MFDIVNDEVWPPKIGQHRFEKLRDRRFARSITTVRTDIRAQGTDLMDDVAERVAIARGQSDAHARLRELASHCATKPQASANDESNLPIFLPVTRRNYYLD